MCTLSGVLEYAIGGGLMHYERSLQFYLEIYTLCMSMVPNDRINTLLVPKSQNVGFVVPAVVASMPMQGGLKTAQ